MSFITILLTDGQTHTYSDLDWDWDWLTDCYIQPLARCHWMKTDNRRLPPCDDSTYYEWFPYGAISSGRTDGRTSRDTHTHVNTPRSGYYSDRKTSKGGLIFLPSSSTHYVVLAVHLKLIIPQRPAVWGSTFVFCCARELLQYYIVFVHHHLLLLLFLFMLADGPVSSQSA